MRLAAGISRHAKADPPTVSPGGAAIQVENVTHVFGKAEKQVMALQGISLDAKPREFVSVLGPSGCGKSTLFHIISGLTRPSSGDAIVQGS